jgi:hypothetical protein
MEYKKYLAFKKWQKRNPDKNESEYKYNERVRNNHKSELFEKIKKDSNLKDTTIKININRVNNLHRLVYNTNWNFVDLKWLKDTKQIFNVLDNHYSNIKTISNQYTSVASILKFFKKHKLQKIYSDRGVNLQNNYDNRLKDNKLTEKQKLKIIRWDEVLKIKPTTDIYNLIYNLYTLIPPRRNEYRFLKVENTRINTKDKNFNFILLNKKSTKLIINNYKSSPMKKYGTYETNLPKKLERIVRNYIEQSNIKNGDFLLNKLHSTAQFSNLVKLAFNNHITVNGLRKSYVSYYLYKKHTLKSKELLALKMGTSLEKLQKNYYKVYLTPTNIDYKPVL